jgi:fibro-slime domain-containing protein
MSSSSYRYTLLEIAAAITLLAPLACSTTEGSLKGATGGAPGAQGGSSSVQTTTARSGVGGTTDVGIGLGGSTGNPTTVADVWPSPQCKTSPVAGLIGAYCLGPEVGKADGTQDNDNANAAAGCGSTLWGIVRDFVTYRSDLSVTSPDFGSYCCNVQKGMVAAELGDDDNPVFTGLGATSSPQLMTDAEHFEQWYNDVEDVNLPYYVAFRLENDGAGTYTFSAADTTHQYFPLDGAGWGNDQNTSHNYSFTTEIHTQFVYRGGEVFKFTGDDDLWVFINRKLAIDIGGVHIATTEEINLDERREALGLEIGGVYRLDLFGAERHAGDSNFRIDTSMTFVNCGAPPPIQ